MKYGISSLAFCKPFPLNPLSLFKKVKEIGFDYIEIMETDVNSIDVEAVKSAAVSTGLGITMCSCFEKPGDKTGDISSEDIVLRERGIAHMKKLIDIAAQVKASKLSGPFYSMVGQSRMLTIPEREQQSDRAVACMKEIVQYAAQKDVYIAIEPYGRFFTDMIETAQQCVDYIGKIGGQDNLGCQLNSFHMISEETDYKRAVVTCGKRLKAMHISGTNRETPGYGNYDWKAIKEGFKEIGFAGEITMEGFSMTLPIDVLADAYIFNRTIESDEKNAVDGLAFLRRTFDS